MKEEALQLASRLAFHQGHLSMWTRNEASAMIRRLVEELDKQGEPVAWIYKRNDGVKFLNWRNWKDCETCNGQFIPLYTTPQTKPLSDEEIDAIGDEVSSLIDTYAGRREFARAIELKHGIK